MLTEVQLPREVPPEEAIRLTIPLSEETEEGRLAAAKNKKKEETEYETQKESKGNLVFKFQVFFLSQS